MLNHFQKSMLAYVFAMAVIVAGTANAATLIKGAGATFPYPLYSAWFTVYAKVDPSVEFKFQAIGSGEGIKQIIAQTVDFGASDKPLSDAELQAVAASGGKLFHIPTVLGAVVVTYHLPGITRGLKLKPEAVADIYLGKITKWNDKRIADDNPGIRLPDQPIHVVHRSDGSGTTSIFTNYLCSVSSEWAKKAGTGVSINWPVGFAGKGNDGVATHIVVTKYSIGYVELAYAFKNMLPYASLKNRSGYFVASSIKSTSAAAAGAAMNMPADYRVTLVNQPGKDVYPIVGFTYLLVYKNQKDAVKGKKLVEFLNWELKEGQKIATELLYAPLPANVAKMVEETIKTIKY